MSDPNKVGRPAADDPSSDALRMRRKRDRERYDELLADRDLVRVEVIVHRSDVKAIEFAAGRLRGLSKVTLPDV